MTSCRVKMVSPIRRVSDVRAKKIDKMLTTDGIGQTEVDVSLFYSDRRPMAFDVGQKENGPSIIIWIPRACGPGFSPGNNAIVHGHNIF